MLSSSRRSAVLIVAVVLACGCVGMVFGQRLSSTNTTNDTDVRDSVKSFTEAGIELESGQVLDGDIVITATGLNLLALGGMELSVDGRDVELSRTLTYRGMMLGGVPNMAVTFGYTNASWTLKCELICRYVTRLLNHMDARGCTQATPRPPAGLTSGATERRT